MTLTRKQIRAILRNTNELVTPLYKDAPKVWNFQTFSLTSFMWRAFNPAARDYRSVQRCRRTSRIGFALIELGLTDKQRTQVQTIALKTGVPAEMVIREAYIAATVPARPILHLPVRLAA